VEVAELSSAPLPQDANAKTEKHKRIKNRLLGAIKTLLVGDHPSSNPNPWGICLPTEWTPSPADDLTDNLFQTRLLIIILPTPTSPESTRLVDRVRGCLRPELQSIDLPPG
jgi:hypothetical protein